MMNLTVTVRHNNHLVYATFDQAGYITGWKKGAPVSLIKEKYKDKKIPYNVIYLAGVVEKEDTIYMEILDSFELEEIEDQVNLSSYTNFNKIAEDVLELFMDDKKLLPNPYEQHIN